MMPSFDADCRASVTERWRESIDGLAPTPTNFLDHAAEEDAHFVPGE